MEKQLWRFPMTGRSNMAVLGFFGECFNQSNFKNTRLFRCIVDFPSKEL